MIETIEARDLYVGSKQFAQAPPNKHFFLPPVGHDFAASHQDHAINLRNDVGQIVGNHDDANTSVCQQTHSLPQASARDYVEGIAGLVE